MDTQLLNVNTIILQYFFWIWAGKCKLATLIYLGILLETYSEPC